MEFKIPLSAEELRLAADCASMVQNHAAIIGQDAPRWLDAPTCEGWWWYQPAGSDLEVVQVTSRRASRGQSFAVLRAGCEADYGFPAYTLSELPVGRWFGPIVPPEG